MMNGAMQGTNASRLARRDRLVPEELEERAAASSPPWPSWIMGNLRRRPLAARHHPSVIDVADLLAAVDDTFRQTSAGLSPWPDPHPDRSPPVDAYSRLTNPARWRILGARTNAWLSTLADAGLAVVDAGADVTWRVVQQPVITRVERRRSRTPAAPSTSSSVTAGSAMSTTPASCWGWGTRPRP